MNHILVDSSVWIDYFRNTNSSSAALSDLIDSNSVCTNDLILAELIPFIKVAGKNELVELLMSITNIEIQIDWQDIIKMQTHNVKNGFTKIGIPDLIILQNAIKNNLYLYSHDKHFGLMSTIHRFKLFGKST
jgi:predicted nucleic acid-binding protein